MGDSTGSTTNSAVGQTKASAKSSRVMNAAPARTVTGTDTSPSGDKSVRSKANIRGNEFLRAVMVDENSSVGNVKSSVGDGATSPTSVGDVGLGSYEDADVFRAHLLTLECQTIARTASSTTTTTTTSTSTSSSAAATADAITDAARSAIAGAVVSAARTEATHEDSDFFSLGLDVDDVVSAAVLQPKYTYGR